MIVFINRAYRVNGRAFQKRLPWDVCQLRDVLAQSLLAASEKLKQQTWRTVAPRDCCRKQSPCLTADAI